MREIRTSGSMRGRRKRAHATRLCSTLQPAELVPPALTINPHHRFRRRALKGGDRDILAQQREPGRSKRVMPPGGVQAPFSLFFNSPTSASTRRRDPLAVRIDSTRAQ